MDKETLKRELEAAKAQLKALDGTEVIFADEFIRVTTSVSIAEAWRLSKLSHAAPTTQSQQGRGMAPSLVAADYGVHWRPESELPEHQQYAKVWGV